MNDMERLGNFLVYVLIGLLVGVLVVSAVTNPTRGASCLNPDCSPPANNGRDILDWGY